MGLKIKCFWGNRDYKVYKFLRNLLKVSGVPLLSSFFSSYFYEHSEPQTFLNISKQIMNTVFLLITNTFFSQNTKILQIK